MSGSGVAAVRGVGSVGAPAPLAIAGCPVSLLIMEDLLGRVCDGAGTSAASPITGAAACFFSRERRMESSEKPGPNGLQGAQRRAPSRCLKRGPKSSFADGLVTRYQEVRQTREPGRTRHRQQKAPPAQPQDAEPWPGRPEILTTGNIG